jgi:hypothetical protein
MRRLQQLVDTMCAVAPDDEYCRSYRSIVESKLRHFDQQLSRYNAALDQLNENDWLVLFEKAKVAFGQSRRNRGKAAMFDVLNEAFAYSYLKSCGYQDVKFFNPKVANGMKSPDLCYIDGGIVKYCEVKTLSRSDEDIRRFQLRRSFDLHVYEELSPAFLEKKLCGDVVKALKQVADRGHGMVYLIVEFDDYTLLNYRQYRRQIATLLRNRFCGGRVFLQVGLSRRRFIAHNCQARGVPSR